MGGLGTLGGFFHITTRARAYSGYRKKRPIRPTRPTRTGAPVCGRPGVQVQNLRRTGAEPANRRKRFSYRFKLHAGEGGGTYLSDAQTLDAAEGELLQKYGDRLAVVLMDNVGK